jgi:hypothetical protein
MADWNGVARTNYVRFADIDGLKEAIKPFDLTVEAHPNGTHHCIDSSDQFGGWPTFHWDEEKDEEIEFSFEEHVAPYLEKGEVLVTLECGAEKLRYLSGNAHAYHFDGEKVSVTSVSMNDIYEKAAQAFGVDKRQIAEAIYDNTAPTAEELKLKDANSRQRN